MRRMLMLVNRPALRCADLMQPPVRRLRTFLCRCVWCMDLLLGSSMLHWIDVVSDTWFLVRQAWGQIWFSLAPKTRPSIRRLTLPLYASIRAIGTPALQDAFRNSSF